METSGKHFRSQKCSIDVVYEWNMKCNRTPSVIIMCWHVPGYWRLGRPGKGRPGQCWLPDQGHTTRRSPPADQPLMTSGDYHCQDDCLDFIVISVCCLKLSYFNRRLSCSVVELAARHMRWQSGFSLILLRCGHTWTDIRIPRWYVYKLRMKVRSMHENDILSINRQKR